MKNVLVIGATGDFGDHMTTSGWLGMALIIGSGICATVLRERAAPDAPAEEH